MDWQWVHRNERLSEKINNLLLSFYKTILEAKKQFKQKSATMISKWVITNLKNIPDFELEYFLKL